MVEKAHGSTEEDFNISLIKAREHFSDRELADEFEVSASTIRRWITHATTPHPRVQEFIKRRCQEMLNENTDPNPT